MKLIKIFLLLPFLTFGQIALAADLAPLETVRDVHLKQFIGEWYAVATIPNSANRNCMGTKVYYELMDHENLAMKTECRGDIKTGQRHERFAQAFILDSSSKAKFKVTFIWPISTEHWVIDLGRNYEYAVVASPDRKFLWVLSRTRDIDPGLYGEIESRLKQKGFDLSRVKKTVQP